MDRQVVIRRSERNGERGGEEFFLFLLFFFFWLWKKKGRIKKGKGKKKKEDAEHIFKYIIKNISAWRKQYIYIKGSKLVRYLN